MLPDQVSNPGPLIYESGALPIALRGPAYYYFTLQLGTFVIFFLFHIEIEGKGGWPKGMLPSLPLSNYWGAWPPTAPPPLPTPMIRHVDGF